MISKKNKALVASVLAAGMTATAVTPAFAGAAKITANKYAAESNSSYAKMFESLYDDVVTNGEDNGYLSPQYNSGSKDTSFGIPYHAVETMVVEAPDYGHETTSEAMSYIVWAASMHDVLATKGIINGSAGDLDKAWNTLEAMIPGWSAVSNTDDIKYETIWSQSRLKADTADEGDLPKDYPTKKANVDAINPLYGTFKSAYGSDRGYYLMHWLADVDDWYGFGGNKKPGEGKGNFTFINTFQRGEQESCFETVPHPCIEWLKYGNEDGIKGIFNGPGVPEQYSFTNAPDAEDRAIQAVYFANRYKSKNGVSAKAGKMGDQCRNDMFDKYYHAIAPETKIGDSGEAGTKSQHFLMGWYTSWGGALDTFYGGHYDWAWQIGCSHSHQFYQNPLAAYALLYDSDINKGMESDGADADYKESLKRQIEMYQWLQSRQGPFAGGCTNSWRGRYETYPSGHPTFYGMAYTPHPVYADPGSNHWIGNQVWSTQRLAELYYVISQSENKAAADDIKPGGLDLDEALDKLLYRWIDWFEKNTKWDKADDYGRIMEYAIPSTLDWGKNDTDWDSCHPDTWKEKYNEDGNQDLNCTIGGYGQGDIGCVSSLCNTLMLYAAAKGVDSKYATTEGTTVEQKALYLANKLLTAQYYLGRDEIGLAFTDSNGSLDRVFKEPVYIPSTYKGTMPDGSKLESGATFSSIRESYAKDPMYQEAEAYYKGKDLNGYTVKDNNGDGDINIKDYQFKLHRFWHMGDAMMAYGQMALLYPDVKPFKFDGGDEPTSELKATKWGDANCDGDINMPDVVLIMQDALNPGKYGINGTDTENRITEQGEINADVESNGNGVDLKDALLVQQYTLSLITDLTPANKK